MGNEGRRVGRRRRVNRDVKRGCGAMGLSVDEKYGGIRIRNADAVRGDDGGRKIGWGEDELCAA